MSREQGVLEVPTRVLRRETNTGKGVRKSKIGLEIVGGGVGGGGGGGEGRSNVITTQGITRHARPTLSQDSFRPNSKGGTRRLS